VIEGIKGKNKEKKAAVFF